MLLNKHRKKQFYFNLDMHLDNLEFVEAFQLNLKNALEKM